MNSLRLSLTMLRRDLRAGELTMLAVALLVAVAALTSVGFLTDRVRIGLERDANQLLGGDLLVLSDQPVPQPWLDEARQRGLRAQTSMLFNSMVSTEDMAQLGAVKAVEPDYPLRGSLKIAGRMGDSGAEAGRVPASGELWLEERLISALAVKVGDTVQLGQMNFRVGGIVTFESDRGSSFFAFVPRILMNAADVPATGLIQEGSRARYRLHAAGERRDVAALDAWIRPQLARGQSLESIDNARPEVREGMDRAQRFLRLAAMLAVVLAAVATGLSARRYLQRHLDGCAAMRCFGATRGQLLRLFLGEFLVFGVIVAAVGCVLGFVVQAALGGMAANLLDADLPAPGFLPVLHGLLVGIVLVLGFIAPQLLRLATVPPVHVLRREWGAADAGSLALWGIGALALSALMLWIAADLRLGFNVIAGFAVACLVFALVARSLLGLAARARMRGAWGLRYGLAALHRRRASSVVQAVALALGITAVLLLTVTSADLLDAWRQRQPADAPNRFVLNIQPEQREPVRALLREHGFDEVHLLPMVRGRLVGVNGQQIKLEALEEERARRQAEREFNLSWAGALQSGNRIVAGRWHGESAGKEWSVEEGIAKRLGIKLGDQLAFEIAGRRIEAPVTSIRKLEWDSMRVNFFVTASPGMLEDYPASFITSFHLPEGQDAVVSALVSGFPNLTVIDVAAVLGQVKAMTDRLIQVVQFIFGFALLAGAVVLYAALQATHDERMRELAVLRTLGARNVQLRQAMLAEFAVLGLLAAALAVIATLGIGFVLSEFVFDLPFNPRALTLLLVSLLTAGAITLLGWLGVRKLLHHTVVEGLRAAA
ncbi:MAG: FtsX-like permease family protein [Moraxellaceae bacterium]|nr:FtsX-like permease family protein [Moraxellaceae bacterium]